MDTSSIYIGAILKEPLQMKRPPDNSLDLDLPKSLIENPIMGKRAPSAYEMSMLCAVRSLQSKAGKVGNSIYTRVNFQN